MSQTSIPAEERRAQFIANFNTMFDLPAAKRIRRADLYSPPSSPEPSEPDPELTALLHSQLENVYGPVVIDGQSSSQERIPTKSEHDEPDSAPNDPEQGFEFRLFATPTSRQPTGSHPADGIAPRIILDDEPDAGDPDRQGGFVVPRRDEGYYFTSTVAPAWGKERRRQFEIAAVSGEDVRRCLGVRYTGWEVRWRVRHLRNGELVIADANEKGVVASPLTAGLGPNGQGGVRLDGERKKGKLGKKRRIILRMRKRKGEEAAERKKREERERGEAEREKRTRRNREKKVKKKMREKEKKGKGENDTAGIDGASGG